MLALFTLIIGACGGSKENVKPVVEPVSESPCPDWFVSPPEDPDFLFAAATATSRDLQMAINKARQDARLEIASQMETYLQGLTKQFKEEIGEGEESQMNAQFTTVSKSVVSTTLNGCKTKNQHTKKEGTLWRACILMEYPIGVGNAQFLQQLKNNDLLRQKTAATDAYKELETEVEKYELKKEAKSE
jgi:hypothetical protein